MSPNRSVAPRVSVRHIPCGGRNASVRTSRPRTSTETATLAAPQPEAAGISPDGRRGKSLAPRARRRTGIGELRPGSLLPRTRGDFPAHPAARRRRLRRRGRSCSAGDAGRGSGARRARRSSRIHRAGRTTVSPFRRVTAVTALSGRGDRIFRPSQRNARTGKSGARQRGTGGMCAGIFPDAFSGPSPVTPARRNTSRNRDGIAFPPGPGMRPPCDGTGTPIPARCLTADGAAGVRQATPRRGADGHRRPEDTSQGGRRQAADSERAMARGHAGAPGRQDRGPGPRQRLSSLRLTLRSLRRWPGSRAR